MARDNTSKDLMLTIEQVSQLTGVRKSTLRYWEKSFEEFLRPARTHSNRREYSLEDLDLIRTIKRLLEEEHLTSEGVRLRLLKLFPQHAAKSAKSSRKKEKTPHKAPIPLHSGHLEGQKVQAGGGESPGAT